MNCSKCRVCGLCLKADAANTSIWPKNGANTIEVKEVKSKELSIMPG